MRTKYFFAGFFAAIALCGFAVYAEKIPDTATVQEVTMTGDAQNSVKIGRVAEGAEYLVDSEKNIISGPFQYIADFGTYPYGVRTDGSWIFFDRDGSVIAEGGAELQIDPPKNGLYATYRVDESDNIYDYAVYDYKSRTLLFRPDGKMSIGNELQSDKMFIEKNSKFAIINKNGELLTDYIYDGVKKCFNPDWEPFPKAYAIVVQDGKEKYIDWDLNEIDLDNYNGAPFITNCRRITIGDYETPYKSFYEVESGEKKHGIYDAESGTYIMPLQEKYRFFTITDLGIFAQLNTDREESNRNVCGLLDMNGNVVIPFEYSYLAPSGFYDFIGFSAGIGDSASSGYYDLKRNTEVYSGAGIPVTDGVFIHSYKDYSSGYGVYCSVIENAAGHNLTGEVYHPAAGYENGIFYNAGYTDNPPEIHVDLDFAVIKVNGKYLDFDGVIRRDRTLVPVRDIIEALGGAVDYSDGDMTVSAALGGKVINMQINSDVMTVDGAEKRLDVPAQLINDKTMIPLRALAEAAGFAVDWDERIKCVYIFDAIK